MFFDRSWGLQYPLYTLVLYAFFIGGMLPGRVTLRGDASAGLGLVIALLALTFMLHSDAFTPLNALLIPVLMALHTYWLVRPAPAARIDRRWLADGVVQVVIQTARYIPEPLRLAGRALAGRIRRERSRTLAMVLAGLVLVAPLLAIVLVLLSSADAVFEQLLLKLPSVMDFSWPLLALRIVWVGGIATVLFAYVSGMRKPKPLPPRRNSLQQAQRIDNESVWTEAAEPGRNEVEAITDLSPDAVPTTAAPALRGALKLDPIIAVTALVALNAVYVLFAAVQFSYLFGAGSGVLPDGTTYADYARRGFSELVFVTLINLSVLLTIVYGLDRRRPEAAIHKPIKALLTLLIASTGIMLGSAFLRLALYEKAYGYTQTRLLVHAFMIYLLVQLALALWRVWSEQAAFVRFSFTVGLLAYALLNYINLDGIIARGNVQRYAATGQFDAQYMSRLGWEAVPYLAKLQQSGADIPGLPSVLEQYRKRLSWEPEQSWLEWNLAEWRARKALGQPEAGQARPGSR